MKDDIRVSVKVTFIGPLRHTSGIGEMALNFDDAVTIKQLIREITKEFPDLAQILVDKQFDDPRPNTLIIINGKEIGVLNGLKTRVLDGDEVVFVPVVHGG